MRWRRGQPAPDVIDQRGGGGGRMPFPLPGGARGGVGGLGLVGVLIFLAIQLLGGGGGGGPAFEIPGAFDQGNPPATGSQRGIPAEQDPDNDLKDFSAYVFTNGQRFWDRAFSEQRRPYQRAKLVLYSSAVGTGCGNASSSVGPFYCPTDERVYLDLSFYRDMARQLGASGDFAWAYVIAHELGHHVQQELGTSSEVQRAQRSDPDQANELSVRLELQADCYAGVWAHSVYAAGDLEEGDVEEAMTASAAVGDDRLQSRGGGQVDPDSFTHGTSAQRTKWFDAGRRRGDPGACDTFAVEQP